MNRSLVRYIPILIGVVLILALLAGGYYLVSKLEKPSEQKKVIQQITVIKPPPPPPEPPPPEEEEEQIEEELEEEVPDDPEPLPDDASDEPAGEDLGVDADAVAGGDSFGLQARRGGRGLLAGGSAYGQFIKAEFKKSLADDDDLRYMAYEVTVELNLSPDGSLLSYNLDFDSGSNKARERLKAFLARFQGFSRAVPLEERGSPFRFKINSVL